MNHVINPQYQYIYRQQGDRSVQEFVYEQYLCDLLVFVVNKVHSDPYIPACCTTTKYAYNCCTYLFLEYM